VREEAEAALDGSQTGSYVVRKKSREATTFVITMYLGPKLDQFKHYRLRSTGPTPEHSVDMLDSFNGDMSFPNLWDLLTHYRSITPGKKGSFPVCLRSPVYPVPGGETFGDDDSRDEPGALCRNCDSTCDNGDSELCAPCRNRTLLCAVPEMVSNAERPLCETIGMETKRTVAIQECESTMLKPGTPSFYQNIGENDDVAAAIFDGEVDLCQQCEGLFHELISGLCGGCRESTRESKDSRKQKFTPTLTIIQHALAATLLAKAANFATHRVQDLTTPLVNSTASANSDEPSVAVPTASNPPLASRKGEKESDVGMAPLVDLLDRNAPAAEVLARRQSDPAAAKEKTEDGDYPLFFALTKEHPPEMANAVLATQDHPKF